MDVPIPQQEFLATIAAQLTFAQLFEGAAAVLVSDSSTSVHVLDHDGANSPQMQHLHLVSLRQTAPQCFSHARHGYGESNPAADSASRSRF